MDEENTDKNEKKQSLKSFLIGGTMLIKSLKKVSQHNGIMAQKHIPVQFYVR